MSQPFSANTAGFIARIIECLPRILTGAEMQKMYEQPALLKRRLSSRSVPPNIRSGRRWSYRPERRSNSEIRSSLDRTLSTPETRRPSVHSVRAIPGTTDP